jgi:hypothetical protein
MAHILLIARAPRSELRHFHNVREVGSVVLSAGRDHGVRAAPATPVP